jgi:branched-chain amino acid transport system permease protein
LEQIIVNGLVLGFLYSLITLGLTLIFSIMGVLNFAHGQMYMLGGFVIYYFYGRFHFNFFISLIICALILAAIGIIFDRFLFRRVLKMATREESSMLLAMGSALLLEEIALLAFGEKSRGVPPVVEGVYQIFGSYLVAQRLFAIVMAVLFILGLILFVKYTKPGMAIRALAQDKEAAYLQGVDIHKMSALGFAIGAALAGLAGGLLAPILMVYAGSGGAITLKSFIMMLIGGFGSVPGAIVGGLSLGFLEALGYAFLPGTVTYLIIFCAVIFLLILRPQGIMGRPLG